MNGKQIWESVFLFSFLTDSANNPKLNSSNSNISVRLEIVLLFAPVWEWIQILIGKIICTRRAPGGPSARVVYTSEPQGGSSGGLSERKALGLNPGLQFHRVCASQAQAVSQFPSSALLKWLCS